MTSSAAAAAPSAHALAALAPKLQHPLPKIRARALASLVFKLRERLADVRALERDRGAAAALTTALVACCAEPALETDALAALELLLAEDAPVLRACLQSSGAAVPLQRAAMGRSCELQVAYEKLIHRIYVTTPPSSDVDVPSSSSASNMRLRPSPLSTAPESARSSSARYQQQLQHRHRQRAAPDATALVVAAGRRVHEPVVVSAAAASGWRFPPVALSAVDEQFLFEFEVTLKLRTSTPELVSCCQRFRNELLRNFPVEVFLQRPAVLQHLLYLAQQPLVSGGAGGGGGDALERALELSLGVNYFDDLDAASYSPKPSSLATAVFVAAMRALEAFVYALQRAAAVCLNPVYLVYESALDDRFSSALDARSSPYPRAMPGSSVSAPVAHDRGAGSQYSLGGAAAGLFASLLPLLVSPHHPRLHVLNVLHLALPLLPEKSAAGSLDATLALDKARIEHIFELLADLCFPATRDVAQIVADYSHSVAWRVLELLVRLLQLHPPSAFQVAPAASAASLSSSSSPPPPSAVVGAPSSESATRSRISVPDGVWRFVLVCASSSGFEELARTEWKVDDIVGFLCEIDSSAASFLDATQAAQSTRSAVDEFLGFTKQISKDSSSSRQAAAVAAQMRLETALKVAHALGGMRAQDVPIAVDGILLAMWSALGGGTSNPSTDEDASVMREIILAIVGSDLRQDSKTAALASARFCSQLATVLASGESAVGAVSSESRRRFVVGVLCDSRLLGWLLLDGVALSGLEGRSGEDKSAADDLWAILALVVTELSRVPESELIRVKPAISLLQHFAFMEPSERVSSKLRAVQPQIVELVNRAERSLSASERLLLIARCLLHSSAYVRRAAASGILGILSEASPASFRSLAETMASGGEELLEDPFAACAGRTDMLHPLEKRLREVALPSMRSDPNSEARRGANLSPSLAKLSALRRVLLATSTSIPSMKETAIRELMLMVDDLPPTQFQLLEELGEVAQVKDLLIENLRAVREQQCDANSEASTEVLLLFLRNLLRRSKQLRCAMRCDASELVILTPFVFDPRVAVRAQMYYILLLLTLTHENFVAPVAAPSASTSGCPLHADAVPEFVVETFGLHSQSWSRCCISTCSLLSMCKAAVALSVPGTATLVRIRLDGRADGAEGDGGDQISIAASSDVEFVLQRLQSAKSHARFLNALYHLIQFAEASEAARARLASSWEQIFERFITVAPQGERDEVVVGSVLSCLNSLVGGMTREHQLRLLQVVKRSFVPLLKGTVSTSFSTQVMRILAHLSSSRVADLFPTLAFDTNLLDVLCSKYALLYSTHPVLHALTLEVVLRFATACVTSHHRGGGGDADPAQLFSEVIHQRLLSLVSPLLAIVCRHRVPGSFIERDIFAIASQTLLGIVSITPRAELLGDTTSIVASDQSLLVDNSWSSRLLFDHCSQLRALGFTALATSVQFAPADVESRLLQLAVDTSMDGSECDAVRGAACAAILEALLRFEDVGDARRAHLKSILGGASLAPNLLRALCKSCEDGKLLVNCGLNLCRLVRILFVKRSALAEHFGDPVRALAAADEAFDVYPKLVQMLSLRTWEAAFESYCRRYLHLRPAGSSVWVDSVLPVVLQLVRELLLLFTTILQQCERGIVDFLLTTALQHQILELVGDVSASLSRCLSTRSTDGDRRGASSCQLHYDALEICATCLCAATARSTGSRPAALAVSSAMSSAWSRAGQVETLAFLVDPQHPVQFRVSLSRVVIAMLSQPVRQVESDSAATRALCSSVFDLYRDCAELRRVEPSSASEAVGVASLRRIATVLTVLLESSAALRHLVVVKRGVHFCSGAIKEALHAVRMAGGFSDRPRHPREDPLVALCERAAIHFGVLAALIGGDREAQAIAMRERVGDVVAANWTTMRLAAQRGSAVLLAALRFVNNLAFANDAAKAAFVVSGATESRSGAAERPRTLFALVAQLAIPRDTGAASAKATRAASGILTSLVANAECVLAAIKCGFVAKLLDDVQRRLRAASQTSKSDPAELATLSDLLGVLAGVAASDDGRRAVYASAETALVDVAGDVLRSSAASATVLLHGSLFVRNLSLSRLTRSYSAVWEPLLDLVLARLLQALTSSNESSSGAADVARFLSCALWSVVFEVQKARTRLLSRPAVVRELEQARGAADDDETAANLERALFLVRQASRADDTRVQQVGSSVV